MNSDLTDIGFKCGVEIHQQLLTKKKLFCRCPAGRYSKEHHAEILRHMRPTLSEMGVYDGCALMEFKTKKEIVYCLNKESVCTYELDDTPPFPINQDALDIAIEIALMCNCSLVDEMHIARKQYLDGSIPTGFQRTAIVGINGRIPFEGKSIEVVQLSIEEDSCREIEDSGHLIKFRTDRLGMPLIEVVTAPCFTSPEEAARGVKHIGRLLRATGGVRRGLGGVRQDVNVSIAGGRRVEIKGVPRYQMIPALTRIEGLRQKALLDIRTELQNRKLAAASIETYERDISAELTSTRSPILRRALDLNHKIRGIKLCNMAGILNRPTQPGRMFSSELAGRVRVIACLDEIPNLFHTDNYPEYPRSHIDSRAIRLALKLSGDDVGVIVWGPEADVVTAISEIKNRIVEAFDGVPNETRQHLRDGLTDFERILPGADRMYPDTDHPPVKITSERVEAIRERMSESTHDIEARLRSYDIPSDATAYLALSQYLPIIDSLAIKGCDMKIAGRVLGQLFRNLQREGRAPKIIDRERIEELICKLEEKKIKAKYYKKIVLASLENHDRPIGEIIAEKTEEKIAI